MARLVAGVGVGGGSLFSKPLIRALVNFTLLQISNEPRETIQSLETYLRRNVKVERERLHSKRTPANVGTEHHPPSNPSRRTEFERQYPPDV